MIHPGLLREAADEIDDPFDDKEDELCTILRQAADHIEQLEKRNDSERSEKEDQLFSELADAIYGDGGKGELTIVEVLQDAVKLVKSKRKGAEMGHRHEALKAAEDIVAFENKQLSKLKRGADVSEMANFIEVAMKKIKPDRERLPDTRQSITHKFKVNTTKGYMIVGLYEDGRPGELFIEIAKEGSTVGGLCDAIGILTSIALQRGVPMEELARKFRATLFEPAGPTLNREQSQATSIIDYVFTWLGRRFCPEFKAEYERLMEAKGSE